MTAKELLAARAFRWCLLATGLLAVLAMAVLGYLRWRPVAAAPGWQYAVLVDDVEMIDSLAVSPAGELLGTTQHNHGKGELVRFDRNWQVTTLLSGLSKPAGLLPWRDGVLIAQEEQNMWVMYWTPSGARPLFRSDYAEGITKLSNGNIVILADRKNGELTEFNPDTGSSRILLSGLDKGEGLCAMPDGRIYFTEKQRNSSLYQYQAGEGPRAGGKLALFGGLQSPGFLLCTSQGIWITEDRTNDGRLLFWDFARLQVIAEHLHAPQSVLIRSDHELLLAEQGRSRLLLFSRNSKP
ncbi:MAG: hypothetical protein IPN78_08870 [Candidatus Accumulibacter sp.]|jgi:hypothetical protein|nr:hypothetical protein [Candidatus Accumulibacter propinquus]